MNFGFGFGDGRERQVDVRRNQWISKQAAAPILLWEGRLMIATGPDCHLVEQGGQ